MALVLIGEGQATYQGERLDGRTALARAGLSPFLLESKDGLAILNGTGQMVGMGALLVRRGINLVLTADIAACLSLEALYGTGRAYDARVLALRPHPRQIDCAAFLRRLIAGSELLRSDDSNYVQDIELNSVNDNPIVFVDEESGFIDVVSAGNFHGEPIALAMDYMKLAVTDLGNMSERRVSRLVDADSNGGVLPMFLTAQGGLESGFMMAQYTAAALASENKVLAHPASADSIPSSANVEDHVSMGATAVRHMARVLDHVEIIVAIELMTAAQGIDFRRREMGVDKLGAGTGVAYNLLRQHVPFLEQDSVLAPHIEQVRQLVESGAIKTAVESHLESNE
jgi:histidine ammonia-lyase